MIVIELYNVLNQITRRFHSNCKASMCKINPWGLHSIGMRLLSTLSSSHSTSTLLTFQSMQSPLLYKKYVMLVFKSFRFLFAPIVGSGIAWFICIYISRGICTVGPSSKAGKINCPPRSLLFKILCLIFFLMLTHTSAKRLLSIDSRGTKHVKYENKYKNSCGTKHAMHY